MTVRQKPQSLPRVRAITSGIDGFLVRVTDGMLAQQHDAVDQVLLVDLDDLHLFEQQFCQRQGHLFHFQATDKLDVVAKIQRIEEHVDMPAKGRVMEDHAAIAEQLGNLFIFFISQFGQYAEDILEERG